jgi:hypothetical protein
MREVLKRKLHEFIGENNGDLLVDLEQQGKLSAWLQDRVSSLDDLPEILLAQGKPAYIVEEICLEALTADLRVSKYGYLSSVLESDFEGEYYRWLEIGILRYEIINIMDACRAIFDSVRLAEDSLNDEQLRRAVGKIIQGYLESK